MLKCSWREKVFSSPGTGKKKCFWINTTNQSQGECLRSVNHAHAYAANSPPPLRRAYSAVPLPHAAPALTWSDTFKLKLKLWTIVEKQQSRKMPHYCPRQREEIRRLTKKSSVKNEAVKELDQAWEKTMININAELATFLLEK